MKINLECGPGCLLYTQVLLQLGVWGRLLVIGLGAVSIVLAVFVTVCFLGPGCLGYNCIYKSNNKERRKSLGFQVPGKDFLLSDVGSAAVVAICNINESFKKTPKHFRTSVCSTISEASLTSSSNTSYTSIGFVPLPTVSLIFHYLPHTGKLIIFLRNIDGLPGKEFPHQTEVVVQLSLKTSTKTHWSTISRAIRNTRSPEYNSEFSLSATPADIEKWCLSVTVYDKDRFNGYRELAAMDFLLRDLGQKLLLGQITAHASLMTCYKKEYGHILLGLSFLPTAQRLTLSLVKAANLNCLLDWQEDTEFRPFARVFLLDGTGKVIQKKKTDELCTPGSGRRCLFDTVLTMQVTSPQMLTATLLIMLCYKKPLKSTLDFGARNSDIEQIRRDGIIGRVVLGNLVTGNKERKHWQVMQERSRRAVTAWHVIR